MPTEQKPALQKPVLPEIHANANLPTLFVDDVVVRSRKDGMFFIRFTTTLPDGDWEQVRLMTDTKELQRIIDVLCRDSKYYPQKPTEPQVSTNK